jgi:hypothetical protein
VLNGGNQTLQLNLAGVADERALMSKVSKMAVGLSIVTARKGAYQQMKR